MWRLGGLGSRDSVSGVACPILAGCISCYIYGEHLGWGVNWEDSRRDGDEVVGYICGSCGVKRVE